MAIARDIIELKKAEILYKSILDNSVDAPYRRNLLNDSYDYVGPAIERISGF
jgi:hypothetical protein